jgi:hypothetical protein
MEKEPYIMSKEEVVRTFRGEPPSKATKRAEDFLAEHGNKGQEVEQGISLEQAEDILGSDFLGPETVEKTFGRKLQEEEIPPLSCTQEELEKAKERGWMLVLHVDKAPDGSPLTMKKMNELLSGNTSDGGKILFDTDWYKNEKFFTEDTPRSSWAFVSKEVIPGSTSKNYLQQTEVLADYLQNQAFEGQVLPEEYQKAIEEFNDQKQEIQELMSSDRKKAAERLANLSINQLLRQKPSEVIYDLLVYYANNNQRLLEDRYTWTSVRRSAGELVPVGRFVADGAIVSGWEPDDSGGLLGVVFSRSL